MIPAQLIEAAADIPERRFGARYVGPFAELCALQNLDARILDDIASFQIRDDEAANLAVCFRIGANDFSKSLHSSSPLFRRILPNQKPGSKPKI